jgi:hypothetical protein
LKYSNWVLKHPILNFSQIKFSLPIRPSSIENTLWNFSIFYISSSNFPEHFGIPFSLIYIFYFLPVFFYFFVFFFFLFFIFFMWGPKLGINTKDERLKNIVRQQSCVLVGKSHNTSFWNDVWIWNCCLAVQFSILYNLSEVKCSTMAYMGF